jgi:hypothetical protein
MAFPLFGLIVLGCVAGLLIVLGRPYVAAWLYKRFSDPDPYPPEAAQARPSLGEHFSTAPIDDLDTSVDWHRYEYEMRKQT